MSSQPLVDAQVDNSVNCLVKMWLIENKGKDVLRDPPVPRGQCYVFEVGYHIQKQGKGTLSRYNMMLTTDVYQEGKHHGKFTSKF